jgi:hypothetical protein
VEVQSGLFLSVNAFLNSWKLSSHIVRYDTNPPAIQKQHHGHSRKAQIEPPLIECECELLEYGRKSCFSRCKCLKSYKTTNGKVTTN